MITFELSILDFIQTHLRSGFGDIVMPYISALGSGGMIWLVSGTSLLLHPKCRKAGVAVLAALALDLVCCNMVLKPLIARIRPCDVNTAIHLLVPRPTDFTFPSGHTAASFSAAAALYFSRRKLWIPAAALAMLIAFSRLYLYLHYPTDVLAGAMLGILLGFVAWKLTCFGVTLLHQKNTR